MEYFAPGKLMIAGEWSVLSPGNTSLIMAVNRGVTVSICTSEYYEVHAPDVGVKHVRFEIKNERVIIESTSSLKLTFFISSIETFLRFFGKKVFHGEMFSIRISSEITSEKNKFGFGSSAALTVALISALLDYFKMSLSKIELFKLSYISHARAQDGRGSGFDVAASVFGGFLMYSMPYKSVLSEYTKEADIFRIWEGLSIQKIEKINFSLIVGFSGKSSSTVDIINTVNTWKISHQHEYDDIMQRLERVVSICIDNSISGSCKNIQESIRKIRSIFFKFSHASQINFETKRIREMCDILERNGYSAKFSGAGGGDSVIAFSCSEHDRKKIIELWESIGVPIFNIRPDYGGVRKIIS